MVFHDFITALGVTVLWGLDKHFTTVQSPSTKHTPKALVCTVPHFLNSVVTHLLHALLDMVFQLLEALLDVLLQVLFAMFLEVLEGVVCIVTSQGESTLHSP